MSVTEERLLLRCDALGVCLAGRQVLDSISFAIHQGDRIALLGPSGCGKSTLLNVLAGLVQPSFGSLQRNVSEREIGFVFQEPSLLPWKTVEENALVLESLIFPSTNDSKRRERLHALLSKVGLLERKAAFPDELSGGMKMRVALVRALMLSPRLLLLDEPFSALDDLTRETLQDELLELHRSSHISYVLVTHHIEEALLLADRILIFSSRGSVLEELQLKSSGVAEPETTRDSATLRSLRAHIRTLWSADLQGRT